MNTKRLAKLYSGGDRFWVVCENCYDAEEVKSLKVTRGPEFVLGHGATCSICDRVATGGTHASE